MNILTLGLVIQEHSLEQLATVGKIVSLANNILPVNKRISPKTTGLELVQIYRSLNPECQQKVYAYELLDRTEVNFLYQEVKYLSQGEQLRDKYSDSLAVNLFLTLLFMHIFVSFIVLLVYKLNADTTGDSIAADFTQMVINIFKFVIKGFV